MDEQNNPTASPSAQSPIYQESQEKNAKWLWLLIVLIIIGVLVFAFFRGIGPLAQFRGDKQETSPTPQTLSSPISEASPSPSEEVDKSEPSIRVLNGSGVAGVASSVKDFLEGLGWKVSSIGNANNYEFDNTQIKLKPDFAKYQDALTADLSDKYSVTVSTEELDATDSADIEITIGTK